MSSEAGESSIHPRSPLQLEFVSVTQDNFQHGKFRQHLAVRRHVMRHVMLERSRRERLAATKKFQQKQGPCQKSAPPENSGSPAAPATQASGEVPTQEGKAAFKDEESCVSVKLNLVKQHPAAWKMDPFGSFAASLDSNTQAGLEYYAKVMVPSTRPSDPQSQSSHAQKVISLILSDDATIASFTAATLIGRALNVYARASENRKICQNDMIDHGSTSHLQSSLIEASDAYQAPAQALMTIGLSYVTKAMRKLGHQMQLSGFSATDGVINTVLELAVCEVMMGETSKGETHCQGLSSMIKTRGGPSSVPSFLMDSVFLTDMHMATISHRKPSYPLLDAHRPSLETLLPEACRSFGLPPPHCQLLGISDKLLEILDQGFATALAQLQDLVNYTDAFEKTLQQVPVDLRKLYVSKTFAVEHGILSSIHPPNDDIDNEVQGFCTIATLLFLKTCIQKWSPYSPLARIVARQLQSSLYRLKQHPLLALDSNFLLWSLFIGAYASSGQVTRSWFLAMIRTVASRLRLESWIDVHGAIAHCFYIDTLFNEPFPEIWLEAKANMSG